MKRGRLLVKFSTMMLDLITFNANIFLIFTSFSFKISSYIQWHDSVIVVRKKESKGQHNNVLIISRFSFGGSASAFNSITSCHHISKNFPYTQCLQLIHKVVLPYFLQLGIWQINVCSEPAGEKQTTTFCYLLKRPPPTFPPSHLPFYHVANIVK